MPIHYIQATVNGWANYSTEEVRTNVPKACNGMYGKMLRLQDQRPPHESGIGHFGLIKVNKGLMVSLQEKIRSK